MVLTGNNRTNKSLFHPQFTLEDYNYAVEQYNYLQQYTHSSLKATFANISQHGNKPMIIRMRRALTIVMQGIIKWRNLLNFSRVTLDERAAIIFPQLHQLRPCSELENPTMCTLFTLIEEMGVLAEVMDIINVSRLVLPLVIK